MHCPNIYYYHDLSGIIWKALFKLILSAESSITNWSAFHYRGRMTDIKSWDIVFDSHFHLNGGHDWSMPVISFKKAGGTAVNLVNLPDYSIPAVNYYEILYERTVKIARLLDLEYSLHVLVSLGPYPLDYFHFQNAGLDPERKMEEGLELAAKYVKTGEASGFGEVGRPHFPVNKELFDFSNDFIASSMRAAKDLDTFVMLHTEDLTAETIIGIAEQARKSGIDPGRVIKHHATTDILGCETEIPKTILATRPNTKFMIDNKDRAMLESDYVDDPDKPGKVIPADSVPRRAIMVRNEAEEFEEILTEVFQTIPYRAFRDEYFKP